MVHRKCCINVCYDVHYCYLQVKECIQLKLGCSINAEGILGWENFVLGLEHQDGANFQMALLTALRAGTAYGWEFSCSYIQGSQFSAMWPSPYSCLGFYIAWQPVSKKEHSGTSLVVQWLRICLLTQGTWVQSLVGELRSHMLQGNQVHAPQLYSPCATTREMPTRRNERS